MQLSRAERLLAEFGIVAMIACLAAMLNLFAPAGTPLGARLIVALTGFIAGWVLVRLLALVGTAAARLLGLGDIWGYVFAVPLASAIIAWAVLWFVGGPEAALGDAFASVWPQTALVGAGFFVLFFGLYWRSHRAALPNAAGKQQSIPPQPVTQEAIGVPVSALHDRLPAGFPAILALCAEDHYLRVIARDRSELLLLPLSEAIALMPAGAGERVHRSWWVARSALISHRRIGRDLQLQITGGTQVPISRAKVATLRQAGWI